MKIVKIPEQKARELQQILDSQHLIEGMKREEIIDRIRFNFDNRYSCEIRVINGSWRCSKEVVFSRPFVEALLFSGGCLVQSVFREPNEFGFILGVYRFEHALKVFEARLLVKGEVRV